MNELPREVKVFDVIANMNDKIIEIGKIASYSIWLLEQECIDDAEDLMEAYVEDLPAIHKLCVELVGEEAIPPYDPEG